LKRNSSGGGDNSGKKRKGDFGGKAGESSIFGSQNAGKEACRTEKKGKKVSLEKVRTGMILGKST